MSLTRWLHSWTTKLCEWSDITSHTHFLRSTVPVV